MGRAIRNFFGEQQGQDLAEYCMLLALVLLIGAGILYRVSGGMQNLWTTANSSIAAGASSGGAGNASASTPDPH